jgi:DNA/RNA endonuclease G (NUC1)
MSRMSRNWFKAVADLVLLTMVALTVGIWCGMVISHAWLAAVKIFAPLTVVLLCCVAIAAAGEPDSDNTELLRFGTPAGTVAIDVPGHACGAYDGRAKNPLWKLALITKELLEGPAVRRKVFHEDVRIAKWMRASAADYAGSDIFDRGHELAAEFFGKQADRDHSFLLSNMTPQNKRLNEVVLNALEQWVVAQARSGKRVWYFSGPYYCREATLDGGEYVPTAYPQSRYGPPRQQEVIDVLGDARVWVPRGYVKSVLVLDVDQDLPVHLHAFGLPNQTPPAGISFWQYATSVAEAQSTIGLDLWSELPEPLQTELEKTR